MTDFPLVTSLSSDHIVHDLAADAAEILCGTFIPEGRQVLVDVQAAYSFRGMARAALLLYSGQPDTPGSRLHDAGAQALPGVSVHSVASINGESAWAATTSRRLVMEFEPGKPVTWQLLGAIIGGGGTVAVPGPQALAITPDSKKAFVASPEAGKVTPIILGRPGYTEHRELNPTDTPEDPVLISGSPTHLSADLDHVVVASSDAGEHQVSVLSVVTNRVVRNVRLDGARASAITPDGKHALIGTDGGGVAMLSISTGDLTHAQVSADSDPIVNLVIHPTGIAAFAADANAGCVYRLGLPALDIETVIETGDGPAVLEISPDGQVWVLCRPPLPAPGRLKRIDPATDRVVADYTLPFPGPRDFAIVPVLGQTSSVVRTAWVVFDGGKFTQMNIGGEFAGVAHTLHTGHLLSEDDDAVSAIAISDFGEIWVTQPSLDHVWRWPGGRLSCRAASGVFWGEYLDVSVYGAADH